MVGLTPPGGHRTSECGKCPSNTGPAGSGTRPEPCSPRVHALISVGAGRGWHEVGVRLLPRTPRQLGSGVSSSPGSFWDRPPTSRPLPAADTVCHTPHVQAHPAPSGPGQARACGCGGVSCLPVTPPSSTIAEGLPLHSPQRPQECRLQGRWLSCALCDCWPTLLPPWWLREGRLHVDPGAQGRVPRVGRPWG